MKEKAVENLHLLYAAKTGFVHKQAYWLTFPINSVSDRCNIIPFVHYAKTFTSVFYWLFRAQKKLEFQLVLFASSSHDLLAKGYFFLITVNDFVTCPARLLDRTFWGLLLEGFKNVIIFCHVLSINLVITWSIPGVKPFPCHVPHSPLSAMPC